MFRIARPFALAFALAGCAAGTRCPPAPPTPPPAVALPEKDPAKTDGDKYQVILENDRVRVLRYHDSPGAKTNPHHHPDFVLYALAPFRRKLTFPDGTSKERDFKPGDVITMPAQDHVGENTGTTDTDVVIVELKR
jgi:quercetin dioxygenase-like cupin family protein